MTDMGENIALPGIEPSRPSAMTLLLKSYPSQLMSPET